MNGVPAHPEPARASGAWGRPPRGGGTGAAGPPGPARTTAAEPAGARAGGGHGRQAAGWEDAWRAARAAGGPAGDAVGVALDAALGAVLADDLTALTDLPAFDTSAMDGWAVAGRGPWTAVDGGLLAGHGAAAALGAGQAVPIATGARLPEGAAAVLRSEHGELRRGTLHPTPAAAADGADVRPRGQECRAGDRLLAAGTPVTPPVLGLAAAAGYDELRVVPAPRVEVLVLGDELLHEGLPHDGRVRDALGPMTGPWLTALGAVVTAARRLPDDADALLAAVGSSQADLVVTTGGTAHGPADHVHPVLRRLGARLLVDGVGVRPGHPMLLAELPRHDGPGTATHLVGLPGNPLAAVSGLLTLVGPFLRARAARPEPPPVEAPLTAGAPGHPRDTRLVPVARTEGAAEPLCYAGPAMLRGVAAADALAVLPPGGVPPGTPVRLLDLPW